MNGDTTYVSSVIHNATFAWGSDSYTTPSHFDMVIYELHVPTMDPSTPQGVSTFQQLIQKLDYLQHLGVNIVEPLPIATFPTAPRQWGYDPGAPFTVMSGSSLASRLTLLTRLTLSLAHDRTLGSARSVRRHDRAQAVRAGVPPARHWRLPWYEAMLECACELQHTHDTLAH